ncbi:MAG: hypothetical protein ACUZ8E_17540 [Candidatus Anammoxibacter sp.]
MTVLLDNVSIDTNSPAQDGDGKERVFLITATSFGSGSVTIQTSEKITTPIWVDADEGGTPLAITVNRSVKLDPLPSGMQFRAVLQDSTGASNVKVVVF